MVTMADKERSSSRHSGPSAEEWERHKSIITDYYMNSSLKDLQSTMKTKHGFIATKRMYDTRFRKWGITKIIKTAEKEQMLLGMRRSPTGSRSPGEDLLHSLSEKDLNKLRRYQNSQRRRESRKPLTNRPTRSAAGSDTEVRHDVGGSSPRSTDKSQVGFQQWTGSTTTSSSSSVSSTSKESPPADSSKILDDSQKSLHRAVGNSTSPHQLSAVSLDTSQSRHQGLILHLVKTYYSSRLDDFMAKVGPADMLSLGTSRNSKSYWSNVKNGNYLWKIAARRDGFSDDHQRGEQALHKAKDLAGAALQTEPSDFVLEMLSTLSPSNMNARPRMRADIFNHLATQASARLSTAHPIALISAALQADPDDSLISRNALFALLDLFSERLGRNHPSTHKIMLTIITQMRRSASDAEVNSARGFAEKALHSASDDYGADSTEARTTAVELAHILTKLGDYGPTLRLRMDVVSRSGGGSSEASSWVRDGITVHTMEDIAEYYFRFGYISQAINWLSRARDIALAVWGAESVSTLHILDKLEKAEMGVLDGQVADGRMIVAK